MFSLGEVVATSGAIREAGKYHVDIFTLLTRHSRCDWGDLDDEDKKANDMALYSEQRLLSKYVFENVSFYIVTEWNRELTTLMLTSDY